MLLQVKTEDNGPDFDRLHPRVQIEVMEHDTTEYLVIIMDGQ